MKSNKKVKISLYTGLFLLIFFSFNIIKIEASTEVFDWNLTEEGIITVPQNILEEFCEGIPSPTGCYRDGMHFNIYPNTETPTFGGSGWLNTNNTYTRNLESLGGSTKGDGNYWFWFGSYNLPLEFNYYVELQRIDGKWSYTDPSGTGDQTTRIIEIKPENGTTTQSGVPVEFQLHAYINPNDIGSWFNVSITFHNIDQNVFLLSALSPSDIYFLDSFQATTSGSFYYSTSTTLADGNYRLNAYLKRSYLGGFLSNPFKVFDEKSTQFIVGTSTFIGNISQNSFEQANEIFGTIQATTTLATSNYCRPFSGEFDVFGCLAFLFIPDAGYLNDSLKTFRDDASTRFPLGYATDLIGILSTTTESSLPLINATLPNGIAGTGSNITLELNNVLDPFLNATTGQFINESATSEDTLFEITNYYWEKFVYFMTLLYILSRILGSGLIPKISFKIKSVANKKL